LLFGNYQMIIVLMFICVCNAITESQVRSAVSAGARSLSDLQSQLGVGACCGCCSETAAEYLPGGRYAGQVSQETSIDPQLATAANDATAGAPGAPMVVVAARRA
jgi:bacterioferritin-associated ferredoxin